MQERGYKRPRRLGCGAQDNNGPAVCLKVYRKNYRLIQPFSRCGNSSIRLVPVFACGGLSMFTFIFPILTHVDLDVQATQFLAKAFWSRDRRAQGGFYNDMMKLGDE